MEEGSGFLIAKTEMDPQRSLEREDVKTLPLEDNKAFLYVNCTSGLRNQGSSINSLL